MKTTVELPDELYLRASKYAARAEKSLAEVMEEPLDRFLPVQAPSPIGGWESLFGAFPESEEVSRVQAIIDKECGRIDPKAWL